MQSCTLNAEVQRLGDFFRHTCQLSEHEPAALLWCQREGIHSLRSLIEVEREEALVAHLGLTADEETDFLKGLLDAAAAALVEDELTSAAEAQIEADREIDALVWEEIQSGETAVEAPQLRRQLSRARSGLSARSESSSRLSCREVEG